MEHLYEADRHEALAGQAWNEVVARAAIAAIVADTRRAAGADGNWPTHPADLPDGAPPMMGLYFGTAGVIWALDYLAAEGVADAGPSFADRLAGILAKNLEAHRMLSFQERGYLLAAAGIELLACKLAPSAESADALATTIADNQDDPARELMWGAPGTMLASLFMHRMTSSQRWADLFRRGAERLELTFQPKPDLGSRIWTQDLYGTRCEYVGAVHGFAGDGLVLWAGRHLLADSDWRRWSAELAATLRSTAVWEAGLVNWPSRIDEKNCLVQICHGAPGVITCLGLLDEAIDDLLLAGGELTWRAGPLTKGANLCHGTAGNGYAFLKLFERTGDQLWLDRARAFAMHAIGQSEVEAAALGRRRYSLWTGDLGLAVYLLDCLQARARFPTLDVF